MALPSAFLGQEPGQMGTPAPNNDQGQQTVEAPQQMELPMQAVSLQTHPSTRLNKDQAYLMVLDRFTYGARPGDLERLRQIGLNQWFSEQLNPSRIDDSKLEAKLADYPAMKMPLNKLMELYPTNAEIKQAMVGKLGAPGGDAARAIYADNEARYKEKKKQDKAGKTSDMQSDSVDVIPVPMTSAQLLAMPADERFKAICHMTLPQLREIRKEIPADQRDGLTAGMSPAQLEAMAAFSNPRGVVEAEDIQVKLLRDVYSERQLQEIMVDFWLNHFNVYMKKSQQAPYYIAAYERQAIRPFALGKFQDLLMATAESPAMLNYLDASESVGPHSDFVTGFNNGRFRQQQQKKASGLNENYAREVMELHTIGVNGGYTQKDVTELAKVFTGWTVGKPRGQDVQAQAQYDPSKHEPGDKMVLGTRIKANGYYEGVNALKMLANSPQCARFISTKLAVRFVGDNPPPAMISRMQATFLETHGDIRLTLLSMINSPEFFTDTSFRAKVKTPQDFVVSAVRAAGSNVTNTAGLAGAIADLGMPLFGMQTPNGYSMKTEAWNSTTALVSRMNFAMALATNRVQGVSTDLDALLGPTAATMTPEAKAKALEAQLLRVPVSARTQKLIMAQAAVETGEQTAELRQVSGVQGMRNPLNVTQSQRKQVDIATLDTQAALAAGLIFGSPEFQRR
jgi:uncharacterized protein (DUF1800 family)